MRKILDWIADDLRRTDVLLILLCLCASALSVLALMGILANPALAGLASTTTQTVVMQVGGAGIGLAALLVLSHIDYHTMARLWKLHLPLCLLLNLLTFTSLGKRVGEADDVAWINIGPMSIQPSELLKISFILTFAWHLSRVGGEINRLRNVILLCLHAGGLILLVHFQGDDGTALIFAVVFMCMMFVAGLGWRYIALGALAVAAGAPLLWFKVMNADQRGRIAALYRRGEETGDMLYQQSHALAAIGSGQEVGTGLFSGNYSYVPSIRNDFIFSFFGNAMGFVGCMLVLLLLTMICVRVVWTSHIAVDDLGRYICVGVFAVIASQTIVNVGMNLMLLPVIGVTLPLFSAGGTSVLCTYLGMGTVVSVHTHSRRGLFLNK